MRTKTNCLSHGSLKVGSSGAAPNVAWLSPVAWVNKEQSLKGMLYRALFMNSYWDVCACVGITASSGQRTVRIVADSQAADVKLGFSEVLSEQIYSLTPSMEVSDAGSLIAGDVEQARQMMSALLANNKAESDGRVCFRLTDRHKNTSMFFLTTCFCLSTHVLPAFR